MMIFPAQIDNTRSCCSTNVDRCPTLINVNAGNFFCNSSYISRSRGSSSALVASSKNNIVGSVNSTRANASRCCSPKDNIRLQSSASSSFDVSSGKPTALNTSCSRSVEYAASDSDCGYISARFNVPNGKYGRCGRNNIFAPRGVLIAPRAYSQMPANVLSSVDLPLPLAPVTNNFSPAVNLNSNRSIKTFLFGSSTVKPSIANA